MNNTARDVKALPNLLPLVEDLEIFSDDFSTDQGWIDESEGAIARDAQAGVLTWRVLPRQASRYYLPIDAKPSISVISARPGPDVAVMDLTPANDPPMTAPMALSSSSVCTR